MIDYPPFKGEKGICKKVFASWDHTRHTGGWDDRMRSKYYIFWWMLPYVIISIGSSS